MKRISSNYDDYTKEELIAECDKRGVEGVTHSSLKADIVAALELSDEQIAKAEVTPPLPAPGEVAYDEMTEPDLLKLCQQMGMKHLTDKSTKRDMIAAINAREKQDEQDAAGKEFPEGKPDVAVPEGEVVKSNPPLNTDYNMSKVYVMKEGNHIGEEFVLCVHEPDTYERTHSLRNKDHFWQGNEKQFRIAFEKK